MLPFCSSSTPTPRSPMVMGFASGSWEVRRFIWSEAFCAPTSTPEKSSAEVYLSASVFLMRMTCSVSLSPA